MKHLLIAACIALLTVGCASHKKTITETHSATDSVAKSAHLRVTTRTIDTVAKSKPDSLSGSFAITGYVPPSLLTIAGKPFEQWTFASGALTVTATLNKATGKVDLQANTKPQDVPVHLHETTIEADTHEAAVKKENDTYDKKVQRTNWTLWLWAVFIVLAIALALAVWKRIII
jgi:hypothetical protein